MAVTATNTRIMMKKTASEMHVAPQIFSMAVEVVKLWSISGLLVVHSQLEKLFFEAEFT